MFRTGKYRPSRVQKHFRYCRRSKISKLAYVSETCLCFKSCFIFKNSPNFCAKFGIFLLESSEFENFQAIENFMGYGIVAYFWISTVFAKFHRTASPAADDDAWFLFRFWSRPSRSILAEKRTLVAWRSATAAAPNCWIFPRLTGRALRTVRWRGPQCDALFRSNTKTGKKFLPNVGNGGDPHPWLPFPFQFLNFSPGSYAKIFYDNPIFAMNHMKRRLGPFVNRLMNYCPSHPVD